MTDGPNRFYWKEIVGTILWIGLIYFFFSMDGWKRGENWLQQLQPNTGAEPANF